MGEEAVEAFNKLTTAPFFSPVPAVRLGPQKQRELAEKPLWMRDGGPREAVPHPSDQQHPQRRDGVARLKRPLSTERLPAGPPALPASGNARSAWGGGHLFSAVSPNSERRALAFAFTSAPGFLISASPFSKIAAFSGLTALTLETMES